MRYIAMLLATLIGLSLGAAPSPAQDRYGKQKVVYHIDLDGGQDARYYRGAMGNIQNHINAVGEANIEIKVVMHGDGVNLVRSAKTDDRLQATIASLKGQRVDFLVCKNTLDGRKIGRDELYDVDQEDVVPSGVAEISHLQMQGYTYIKP
jgi:hypothetical protein